MSQQIWLNYCASLPMLSILKCFHLNNLWSKLIQFWQQFPFPLLFQTLHFPSNQRPDTGHAWNNLIFTWNGGQYSLLWNAVRLYADKGYGGNENKLEWNAWVNLGEPNSAEGNGPNNQQQFVGSITRVNMVKIIQNNHWLIIIF